MGREKREWRPSAPPFTQFLFFFPFLVFAPFFMMEPLAEKRAVIVCCLFVCSRHHPGFVERCYKQFTSNYHQETRWSKKIIAIRSSCKKSIKESFLHLLSPSSLPRSRSVSRHATLLPMTRHRTPAARETSPPVDLIPDIILLGHPLSFTCQNLNAWNWVSVWLRRASCTICELYY